VTEAKSDSPVFIIGSERSGSNLLRLVLNAHSRITVPHPPHFMRYLAPIGESYGDLTVVSNRRALTRDALMLLRRHLHPWPHPINEHRVVAEASPTVFGVIAAIYEQYRIAEVKARWGCKSTFMVEYVRDVLVEYPTARFIWLVRDPRDVASSAKRSVFGYCDPFLMARLWEIQQQKGFDALQRWGPQVVHLLRYEDLVTQPEREVSRICDFLAEQIEPAMLEHHRSKAARQTAGLSESWRNAAKPIFATRIGAHESGLTRRERLLVDKATAEMKRQLGYSDNTHDNQIPEPLAVELLVRSVVLRSLVECRSILRDANYFRRMARDLTVRWLQIKALMRRLKLPSRESAATS
jgi:hypothetical protein